MVDLGGLRPEQEEIVVIDSGDGELAHDPPFWVEHRREGDPPELEAGGW